MTATKEGETLLLHIVATNRVVSTAIVIEREEVRHVYKVQQLVYIISEVLNESKTCYLKVHKLLYAILITSRKLCHYFDTYPIEVVMEFPLGDILRNKDANECIIKWALELNPYTLEFQSRQTIKSQALVDFIIEWTGMNTPVSESCPEHWKMYFDGSLNIDGVGAGVYFISPSGDKLSYVLQIHFKASNNATKYEVALHGLCIAVELDIKWIIVFSDSALVIRQVNKDWATLARRWMLIALKSGS
jgi:hypothetical protein